MSDLGIHGDNALGCGVPNGAISMYIYRWITLIDQANFEKRKKEKELIIEIWSK